MNKASPPRFDPYVLKDLAGGRVFARGQSYFDSGAVDILSFEPSRVLARVAGTEDYRTVLFGQGSEIRCECSCPAFEREGICKHVVATALAANAAAASGETGGTLMQVRDYLKSRSVDALVDMVLDLAERDRTLLRKLEIAAAAIGADDGALEKRLRKTITDATRAAGFVDYWDVPGWAAGVNDVLDLLAELASGPHASCVLRLADHALSRIEDAVEAIDDSDGHCSLLLARARDIHLEACRVARPEPVALAQDLFLRETEGEYDTFTGAAALYADVLGEPGLAEYRRLANDVWEKLPPRTRGAADGSSFDYFTLASILDFFAERDGDAETRIALRTKNLSSPWAYLQLAAFCRECGREEEALRWAEEGLWLFEDDRPDGRLVFFTVDLLLKAGRKADAEAHLWRAFERAPDRSLLDRLRELGGEAAMRRAVEHLRRALADSESTGWHSPSELLIGIMIDEKKFGEAWSIVRDHGASQPTKDSLARASEATFTEEALAFYAERVEELARTGGNRAYGEAATLIARMGTLRNAAEQAAYLVALKERHGRKRNLMKLLG